MAESCFGWYPLGRIKYKHLVTMMSEDTIAELRGDMAELGNEVRYIRGGWDRLTKSNTELFSRMATIDITIGLMSQTLARMENNQLAEKAAGKKITSDAGTSHHVRSVTCDDDKVDDSLGYRGIHNVLENRNGMLKKIELHVFDGTRPYGWITQVERFFRLGKYSDTDKLDLMSVSLQGLVLNWYNREIEKEEFQNWPQFKKRMIARFSQKLEENLGKRLFSMKQTGSIADYVNEFEELSIVVKGVDEANLEHVFYFGLKPEMQEVIKLKEPRGLTEHFNAVMRMKDSAFCTSMASSAQNTQQYTLY